MRAQGQYRLGKYMQFSYIPQKKFNIVLTCLCVLFILGKMYVCQYCKAEFAQSIELTRHVRTHTGDRPYVCRECGKGYSQASGLTAHLHTSHSKPPNQSSRASASVGVLGRRSLGCEDQPRP